MSCLPSGNHNKSAFQHTCFVGNDLKRFFKQPCNILGKACALDRSIAFGSLIWHQKEETGFLVLLVRQCATLKCLHVCIVFSSDIRQTLTLFCPSISQTHSHGEVSTQQSVNMFEFEQGVEISPKLRSLGEMGLSL